MSVTCRDPSRAKGRGETMRLRSPRTGSWQIYTECPRRAEHCPGPEDAMVTAIGSVPKGLLHRNQCSFLPPGASRWRPWPGLQEDTQRGRRVLEGGKERR